MFVNYSKNAFKSRYFVLHTYISDAQQHHESIPQPPTKPLVGNPFDSGVNSRMQVFMKIAQEYSPIVQMDSPSRSMAVLL